VQIPEVGINLDKRRELNTQIDYDLLFKEYKETNLSKTLNYQKEIFKLLEENKRIALTCFEADTCQCHKTHLAEAISDFTEFKYVVEHLL
jgi:uncharacterized protein (DUF488 family)